MYSVKRQLFFTALRQYWTIQSCQNDIWLYDSFFIFRDWMPFLAPTLDDADPDALRPGDTPGFYLHHIEVEDQEPASG